MEGTITSPLSGTTFTWTDGPIVHPITAASADAKPTGSSDKKDSKDGDKSDEANETGKQRAKDNLKWQNEEMRELEAVDHPESYNDRRLEAYTRRMLQWLKDPSSHHVMDLRSVSLSCFHFTC